MPANQLKTRCIVSRVVLICSLVVLTILAGCSSQQPEYSNPTVVALMTQQASLKAQVELHGTIVSHLATRVGAQVIGTPKPNPTFTPYLTPIAKQGVSTFLPTFVPIHLPTTRTGLQGVDVIIDTVLAMDEDAMRQLIHYTTTACSETPGLGGPPQCEADEADGTIVEVLPGYTPEGLYVRSKQISKVLQFDVRGLYAVFTSSENSFNAEYWPAGQYGIIFIRTDSSIVIVRSDGDGIVRIDFTTESPEKVLIQSAGKILLAPPTYGM